MQRPLFRPQSIYMFLCQHVHNQSSETVFDAKKLLEHQFDKRLESLAPCYSSLSTGGFF
jgi:hypothetical protein